MSSSFYGLEIAKTGLFISQKAINVSGHNIANANTVGYTRQRVISEAIDPADYLTRFASAVNGRVGGGARVQSLEQVRDAFIDKELRREYGDMGYWETRNDALEYIETMFDETDSSALTKSLNAFINGLKEFSQNPSSQEIRTNLRMAGITLTDTFHGYYEQLTEYQSMQNDLVGQAVADINGRLSNIAAYNDAIMGYELSGEKANDLRDKRNVELDELSKLVNIEYSYDSDGHLNITSGGQTLLSHTTVNKLEAETNVTTGFYDVVFESSGTALNYSGGKLEAYRQMRDGATASDMGIPYMMNSLNELAKSLAMEMNAIHEQGYTLATSTNPSVNGISLFEVPAGGYGDITAGNFSLSAEVLADINNFAASSTKTEVPADGDNSYHGDAIRALELYELCGSTTLSLTSVTGFQTYLQSFMVDISIEAGHTQTMYNSESAVIDNLETRKESVSGVSVDEEMVTLIKSQHMYSASSRIMTAIDEALDVLINRTGVVGRS
ncbi:MAG TPA: flagellar hook-associated protein FlgK [Clostridia bacterium]|nr:flagellar hook-associated protein FlgK [Clostridia bacterium]